MYDVYDMRLEYVYYDKLGKIMTINYEVMHYALHGVTSFHQDILLELSILLFTQSSNIFHQSCPHRPSPLSKHDPHSLLHR